MLSGLTGLGGLSFSDSGVTSIPAISGIHGDVNLKSTVQGNSLFGDASAKSDSWITTLIFGVVALLAVILLAKYKKKGGK